MPLGISNEEIEKRIEKAAMTLNRILLVFFLKTILIAS